MPESDPESTFATLAEALRWLRGVHAADPGLAEPLLLGVLDLQRNVLFSRPETVLSAEQIDRVQSASSRLRAGEPLAYVLGRQGFWEFDLEVSPEVLIPRPDTELLVRAALARLPRHRPLQVADLGTGSGAVAMALAAERPAIRVLAVDRSRAALGVARRNAARLSLDNLDWLVGDWLSALVASFDLIASNPPYLAEHDPHLQRDGLDREPRLALVSGPDGLDAIRCIIDQACARLRPGGWLLLEHGWEQGAAVRDLLRGAGYAEVFTERDLAGRERVSGGFRSA